MPTISDGFAGFSDLIFPVVLMFSPPMISGYSRPSSECTLASAARMARAFSGLEKSVNGSFRNGPSGRERFCLPTRTASNVAAMLVTSTRWDEYLILRQPSGFFSPAAGRCGSTRAPDDRPRDRALTHLRSAASLAGFAPSLTRTLNRFNGGESEGSYAERSWIL